MRKFAAALWGFAAACAGQAYMVGTMAFMFYVGVTDVFGDAPFPPEIADAAPRALFAAYGAYLSIGAVLVVIGCGFRYRLWAVRTERVGHVMVATAMLFFAGALGVFGASGEADPTEMAAVRYLSLAAAVLFLQSVNRWWWLGRRKYKLITVSDAVIGGSRG